MTTKCLVVSENDFMVAGVKTLLAAHTDVEVHSIRAIIEIGLAQTIKTLNPDVLILDEGVRTTPPAQLQKLLASLPGLQVIVLNQEDNVMQIYQGEWFEEAETQDMGKVIRNRRPHFRSD